MDRVDMDFVQAHLARCRGEQPPEPERPVAAGDFELGAWIAAHVPGARGPEPWSQGPRLWTMTCPRNPEHDRGEAFIGELANGAITAGCHHNSCQSLDWRAVREHFEPGCYDGSAVAETYQRIVASASGGSGKTPEAIEPETQTAPSVTTLADVEPEEIEWIWPGRLATGKITLISGDPGGGKSVFTLDIAARFSCGGKMPVTGETVAGADVLILGVEDGLADTVRPRLDAAGADVRRVHAWLHREGSAELPRFPGDVDELRRHIETTGARLLVIDPLNAFVDARLDVHKDQHVRAAMAPLARALEETGCSALIVRHLNKKSGASAMHRGGGSIAITGVARVELLVGDHPSDDGVKVVAHVKGNIAAGAPSLGFRISGSEPFGAAKLTWTGEVSANAEDLVEVRKESAPERASAREFLLAALRDGPMESRQLIREAKENGVSEPTLRRAKAELRVDAYKSGFGTPTRWSWRLPLTEGDHREGDRHGS